MPNEGYLGSLTSAVWSIPHMAWVDKLMLVDPEVDISDTSEVLEELITRARPDRVYGTKPNKPIPMVEAWASQKDFFEGFSSSLNYDCTTHPGDNKVNRIKFENLCNQELQHWAFKNMQTILAEDN